MHDVANEEVDPIELANKLDVKLANFNRRMLAYVSGKYRDKSEWGVEKNIQLAESAAAQLWCMGYAVICPHKNTAHFGGAANDSVWLEGDMVMVERSDLVVMLDNWEASEGARLERRLALKLGIPVYYWGVHQLALTRLAANDYRSRSARASIFGRATQISSVTGYRPDGQHVASAPASEVCSGAGTDRRQGLFVDQPKVPAERHAADLAALANEYAAP